MKAAHIDRYGPPGVIEIRDLALPEPAQGEILVRVHAAAVTTADWRLRASAFPAFAWLPGRLIFGIRKPKVAVPGQNFAGTVAAAGADVTRFKPGDRVFGVAPRAHAEYLVSPADGPVALTPANLSDAEAAAVPFGGLAALCFLRDQARVQPGQSILIAGASGSVGVFATQLARHLGARVTAIASGANLALLEDLGAETVIDYTDDDPTSLPARYDAVLDTAGTLDLARVKPILDPGGVFVPLEFDLREIVQALATNRRHIRIGISQEKREDLEFLAGLLARGEIRPVLDRLYPLDEIVAANARVESRHKPGTVILTMLPGEA